MTLSTKCHQGAAQQHVESSRPNEGSDRETSEEIESHPETKGERTARPMGEQADPEASNRPSIRIQLLPGTISTLIMGSTTLFRSFLEGENP